MGGQAQENVSQFWLTPEALIDFVEELRHTGFNIGVAEYIAAQDLLLMLTAHGEDLQNSLRAASLLGPLLCSSPGEQEVFPEYFERWSRRRQASLQSDEIAQEETMADVLDKTARRGLRWEWILFALGIAILSTTAWFVARNFIQAEYPGPTEPSPTTSGSYLDSLPLIPLILFSGMLLILAYAAWTVWWRRMANQFLHRRQSGEKLDIKKVSLTASDNALYPSLTFLSLARLFRQRVQVVSKNLNIVSTVDRSVEQGGWLDPVYDRLLVPPEYLVLVDRRSRFDHLAEFVEGMVKRLEMHGVFVTAFVFDGDPRLCFPVSQNGPPQSLSELAARYENMRLIVFTESQNLLNPLNGRLPTWSRLFNRWTERSIFTPESPENWGGTEQELQRHFILLPGTADGLASFMRIIQGQEKIASIKTVGENPIPPILQERPQRWIERNSPSYNEIDSMLDELKVYLGEDGYTWFEACAVYPELQWQITITLGQLLKDSNGKPLLNSNRIIDLARLPWFRFGVMPDWLRTHLILNLSPAMEEDVRTILDALLVTAVQGHGEALDLEIAYEHQEWTSRLARPLLRLLRQESSPDSPFQERVYLDFMLKHTNLAVRIPNILRRQLFSRVSDRLGWKLLIQWTALNLLPLILPFAVYIASPRFMDTYFIDEMNQPLLYGLAAFHGLILGLAQWWLLRRYWKFNPLLWTLSCMFVFVFARLIDVITDSPPSNYFGLWSLSLLGLVQGIILSRRGIRYARLWFFGNLFAGMINSLWLFLALDQSLRFSWYLGVTIINSLIYSLSTGWVLIYILRTKAGANLFIRQTWVIANSVSFFLGFLISALVVYLVSNVDFLFFPIWMLAITFSQWIVLRDLKYTLASAWFEYTFIAVILGLGGLLLMGQHVGEAWYDYVYELAPWIGLMIGLGSGLAHSIIWWRSGVKPFQMLIWFLSNVIGWLIALSGILLLENFNPSNSFIDLILVITGFIGMSYGFVTCWSFQPLIRRALRNQQASDRSATGEIGAGGFSVISLIAKIRGQESSTRTPL